MGTEVSDTRKGEGRYMARAIHTISRRVDHSCLVPGKARAHLSPAPAWCDTCEHGIAKPGRRNGAGGPL